jgi:hypothetical protein
MVYGHVHRHSLCAVSLTATIIVSEETVDESAKRFESGQQFAGTHQEMLRTLSKLYTKQESPDESLASPALPHPGT